METLDSSLVRSMSYLAVAVLCLWAWHATRTRGSAQSPPAWCWLLVSATLVVLALARLLDFGHLLGDLGRQEARAEGWYPRRRPIQADAIRGVVVAFALIALTSIAFLPRRYRQVLPAGLATAGLATFLVIRAISLHRVDAVLNRHVSGELHVGSLFELAVVGVVAATVVLAGWQAGRVTPPSSDRTSPPSSPE